MYTIYRTSYHNRYYQNKKLLEIKFLMAFLILGHVQTFFIQLHILLCKTIFKRKEMVEINNRKKGGGVLNFNNNALIGAETTQKILSKQISNSVIIVRNSCNVNVSITDTQTAITLQSLLQVLTFILTLIGLDANSIRLVTIEVLLLTQVIQSSNHKIIIENSRNVNTTATNIDSVIFIQTLTLVLTILLVI